MLNVGSFKDLERFGIVPLTGESCGLMYRILCDCTEQGRKVIAKCLGIPDLALAEPWNSGADNDPHVGSIMLSDEMIQPLGIFALLENGCREAWLMKDGRVIGFDGNDLDDVYRQRLESERARVFAYEGNARDRNRHCMTGRVT